MNLREVDDSMLGLLSCYQRIELEVLITIIDKLLIVIDVSLISLRYR